MSLFLFLCTEAKVKKKKRQRNKGINSLDTKALILYFLLILKEVPPLFPPELIQPVGSLISPSSTFSGTFSHHFAALQPGSPRYLLRSPVKNAGLLGLVPHTVDA